MNDEVGRMYNDFLIPPGRPFTAVHKEIIDAGEFPIDYGMDNFYDSYEIENIDGTQLDTIQPSQGALEQLIRIKESKLQ